MESRLLEVQQELARLRRAQTAAPELSARVEALASQVEELSRVARGLADSIERPTEAVVGGGNRGGTSGFDEDGLYLAAPDGSFLFRPRLSIQTRYELFFTKFERTEISQDVITFSLPAARLRFTGHAFRRDYQYEMMVDFARDEPLLDAHLTWATRPWFNLRVGQMRIPFSRQSNIHRGRLLFPERSLVTQDFLILRDQGIRVSGGYRMFAYAIGVYNGAGRNNLATSLNPLYAGRLLFGRGGDEDSDVVVPGFQLRVGLSGAFFRPRTDILTRIAADQLPEDTAGLEDLDDNFDIDRVDVLTLGGEVMMRYHRLSLMGEYFWRREKPRTSDAGLDPALFEERTFWGFYAQGAYKPEDRIELGARYGLTNPNQYGTAFALRGDRGKREHELGLVATWMPFGFNAKFQVAWEMLIQQDLAIFEGTVLDGRQRRSNRIRLQLQLDL